MTKDQEAAIGVALEQLGKITYEALKRSAQTIQLAVAHGGGGLGQADADAFHKKVANMAAKAWQDAARENADRIVDRIKKECGGD